MHFLNSASFKDLLSFNSDITSSDSSVITVSGNVAKASKLDDIKLVCGAAGKITLQVIFGGKTFDVLGRQMFARASTADA